MPSEACEFERLFDVLARGDRGELEQARRAVDGFPQGVDPFLYRPWIVNAVEAGTLGTVTWMIGLGVALNDAEGTPLIQRCLSREGPERYAILVALIAAGADVNARGADDRTPLHLAAAEDDRAALEALLAAGADPAQRSRSGGTAEEEARSLGHAAAADLIAGWTRRG
jgi:hypothetical protein